MPPPAPTRRLSTPRPPAQLLDDSQERTLRSYTLLRILREAWPGAFLVSCGLGPDGAALARAAHIAGAVALILEENPDTAKAALRSGSCDFVVNTLDEALRTIKNEIRKHRPLSVALTGRCDTLLQAIVERGLAPGVFCDRDAPAARHRDPVHAALLTRLSATGCQVVDFDGRLGSDAASSGVNRVDGPARLGDFVQSRGWTLESFAFSSLIQLRSFDELALSVLSTGGLPPNDLRAIWLRAAPSFFSRERPARRVLWISAEERNTLLSSFPDSQ